MAVDAMGGDFAPAGNCHGGNFGSEDFHIPVVLVGDDEKIRKILADNGESLILHRSTSCISGY